MQAISSNSRCNVPQPNSSNRSSITFPVLLFLLFLPSVLCVSTSTPPASTTPLSTTTPKSTPSPRSTGASTSAASRPGAPAALSRASSSIIPRTPNPSAACASAASSTSPTATNRRSARIPPKAARQRGTRSRAQRRSGGARGGGSGSGGGAGGGRGRGVAAVGGVGGAARRGRVVGWCGGRGEGAQVAAEAVEVAPPEAAAVLVFVAVVDEMDYIVEIPKLLGGACWVVGCHDCCRSLVGFVVRILAFHWLFSKECNNNDSIATAYWLSIIFTTKFFFT